MAKFCTHLKFKSPWLTKKGFFMGETAPDASGSAAPKDTVEQFKDSLEAKKELNNKDLAAAKSFLDQMKATRDPKKYYEVITQGGKLVEQLLKIQEESKDVTDKVALEKYEAARTKLLADAKSDWELAPTEIEGLAQALRGADERIALLEAHMKPKFSYNYLKSSGPEGKRVLESDLGTAFNVGNSYTIDFGLGDPTVDQAKAKLVDQAIGLHHIMAPNVTEVSVTAPGKAPVHLIRCGTDQKFREPSKVNERKWYPIHQGYSVKIEKTGSTTLEASGPELKTQTEVDALAVARLQEEASAREEVYHGDVEAKQSSYLETAVGTGKEGDLNEYGKLAWGIYSEVPADLVKLTNEDFADRLKEMELGEQLLGSLNTFKKLSGSPSEVDVWNKIRTKGGNKKVYFEEVTRVVMNKDPMNLRLRYFKIKDELLPEDATKHTERVKELEKVNTELSKLNASPQKNSKEVQARIKGLEKTKAKLEKQEARFTALTQELARMEAFYKAAVPFMAVIPHLKDNKKEAADVSQELSPELKRIQSICDLLFVRTKEDEELRGRNKGHLSMQNVGRTDLINDYMNRSISDEAAWVYLSHLGVKYGSKGEIVGDPAAFFKEVMRVYELGYLRAQNSEPLRKEMGIRDMALLGDNEEGGHSYSSLEAFESALKANDQDSKSLKAILRIGMTVEMEKEKARNLTDVTEYQRELAEKSPAIAAQLDMINEMAKATLGEPLTLAQQKEIAENLKTHYLGTVGILLRNKDGDLSTGLGLDANIPVCKSPPITLHAGLKNNVYTTDFELHFGANAQLVKTGRFELHMGGGLNVGLKEGGVGVGAGLGSNIELGEKRIYSLSLNAGVGLNPSNLAGALAFSAGIERDVGMAVAVRTEERREASEEGMSQTLAAYKKAMVPNYMSEVEYKAFENNLYQMMMRELSGEVIKDLEPLQFLGAGLSYIPPMPGLPTGLVIPYVKIGIKGKPFMAFSKPSGMPDVNEVAQARLDKAMAGRAGGSQLVEVYRSGTTLINENGERTISTSESRTENLAGPRLDDYNKTLAEQGLHLENVGGRLRLSISKVDGAVDIYTDPKAKIQTYPKDKEIYLNLDQADNLHISRVDHYSPRENFGATHRVEIYITNNGFVDNDVIRGESDSHIHYTEAFGKRTDPETIVDERALAEGFAELATDDPNVDVNGDGIHNDQTLADNTARTGAFESEEALLAAGYKLGDFMSEKDQAERTALRAEMVTLLGQNQSDMLSSDGNLDNYREDYRTDVKAWAESMMKNREDRLDYKSLSVLPEHDAQIWLEDHLKFSDDSAVRSGKRIELNGSTYEWSPNRDTTILLQALMIASLAKTGLKENIPERNRQVLEWNEKTLYKVLAERNITGDQATRIATAIMGKFKADLEANLLPPTNIPAGSIVQIQVGTEKIEGYREVDWTRRDDGNLVATIPLDAKTLTSYGLTSYGLTTEDQLAIIEAFTGRLAPLDVTKQEEFMRSQLGLSVLDAADLIFSPEENRQMIALFKAVQMDNGALKDAELAKPEMKAAYEKFTAIVTTLRNTGRWENDQVVLSTRTEKAVGLYQQCLNLTAVMREGLVVQVKQPKATVNGATVTDYLEGRVGVDIYGGGMAVTYIEEKTPPETPPDNGSKDPEPSDDGTGIRPGVGSGRPEVNPGQPGTGDGSGADDLQDE